MSSDPPSDDLAAVARWRSSGGEIEILDLGPPIVVALCTCDGGQEMQRIVSWAPDLTAHLKPSFDRNQPSETRDHDARTASDAR